MTSLDNPLIEIERNGWGMDAGKVAAGSASQDATKRIGKIIDLRTLERLRFGFAGVSSTGTRRAAYNMV